MNINKQIFAKTKYFIIDMDGTFYLSNRLIDGSDDFIRALFATGRDYRFFTNNSSNNAAVCCEKLAGMGFPVDEDRIILSTFVAADYLKRNYPGKRVYLLGNERLTADFISAGITLDNDNPEVVVLGFDTTLTYEKINKAARLLADGLPYVATHPDVNCPTADGFMPDTGSMIELFAASTGRRPTVTGKPTIHTVNYITSLLHCGRDEIAFVGDRLATDIAIGADNGITCALVLSGVTSMDEYERSGIKADVVAENLAALAEYL